MLLSIAAGFLAGIVSSVLFKFVFFKIDSSRLYSLECDVADLQDRHLRSVRKAGALKRWDEAEDVDAKIEELTLKGAAKTEPEKGRMKKWLSTSESS